MVPLALSGAEQSFQSSTVSVCSSIFPHAQNSVSYKLESLMKTNHASKFIAIFIPILPKCLFIDCEIMKTYIKSNRLRCGIGDRRGLAEWHLILSDLICWWWFARKLSSNNLGGHGQKFYFVFHAVTFLMNCVCHSIIAIYSMKFQNLPVNSFGMHPLDTAPTMDLAT